MSYSSQVGVFQVGSAQAGTVDSSSVVVSLGRALCTGIAIVALSVVAGGTARASGSVTYKAGGAVQTSGSISAVTLGSANIRVTQVVAEAVYELRANANIRVTQMVVEPVIEVSIYSAAGQASCFGNCLAATINHAFALGIARGLGEIAASQTIPASAVGRVYCRSNQYTSLRRIALIGAAATQGSAWPNVGVRVAGVAATRGFATATGSFLAQALGITSCSGSIRASSILARAVGVVHALGSCVPPLIGSSQTCLSGPNGPASIPTPRNRAY